MQNLVSLFGVVASLVAPAGSVREVAELRDDRVVPGWGSYRVFCSTISTKPSA